MSNPKSRCWRCALSGPPASYYLLHAAVREKYDGVDAVLFSAAAPSDVTATVLRVLTGFVSQVRMCYSPAPPYLTNLSTEALFSPAAPDVAAFITLLAAKDGATAAMSFESLGLLAPLQGQVPRRIVAMRSSLGPHQRLEPRQRLRSPAPPVPPSMTLRSVRCTILGLPVCNRVFRLSLGRFKSIGH